MSLLTALEIRARIAASAINPFRPKVNRGVSLIDKPDEFVRGAVDAVPQKLQKIFDGLGEYENEKRKFLTELYSAGVEKFDFIYNHKYFNGSCPYFNDEAFVDVVKKMPEKEIKETFDEISHLYETLPKVSNDYDKVTKELIYQPQTPNAINLAQLTILKAHNKEAYEYIMKNPDKEFVSDLLANFNEGLNGSTFETLTIAQIKQIAGQGRKTLLNLRNPDDNRIAMKGFAAEGSFIDCSDIFYQHPEDIKALQNYLSRITITEPFTAFRAEKDSGMFASVVLDKNMTRKVKLLALKNMFKARKVKVHDYNGTYSNSKFTDLFSHIMNSKELTLADAMQVAKYGGEKFRSQIIDLIKQSQIQDNRFKSLTFDRGFAKQWVCTQDGHTKILQNMQVSQGLHGKYSSRYDNRQAEYILNNDPKVMSFQDVKYDPKYDLFYVDSLIKPV